MTDDRQVVEGCVDRVLYENEESGFAVVRLTTTTGDRCTATGKLGSVRIGDALRLLGVFRDHPRYGTRFEVAQAQPRSPRTLEGIVAYLAGPRVEGIGRELARRLVDQFGSETLEILDDAPERLLEVPGIGKKRLQSIVADWRRHQSRRESLIFLQGHGLGPAQSERVLESLGDEALPRIRENPYCLISEVTGVGFRTADTVARSLGIPADAPARLAAGILHVLEAAAGEGHVSVPGAELMQRASDVLDSAVESVRDAARKLAQDGAIIVAGAASEAAHVYLPFLFRAECEAAERLRSLAAHDKSGGLTNLAARELDRIIPDFLDDRQRRAIRVVCDAPIAILTGGPGVGKTTVVRTLCAAWRHAGCSVALASPTGRAAKRLAEVTGQEAKTIHRLLQYDPRRNRFARDESNPVDADVLVVDEASMLDLPLFVHLLRGIRPTARLVLVGDADQLPSVGPGSVLADVSESGLAQVVRLERVHRQAGNEGIVDLAHGVLRGDPSCLDACGGSVRFIAEEDVSAAPSLVRRLVFEELPRTEGVGDARSVQVLAPMHGGPVGTRELNRVLQRGDGSPGRGVRFGETVFAVGDRVMQTRNDYDREVYNGDVGVVAGIDSTAQIAVIDFDGRRHEYRGRELGDVQLAWAITVHKSQGGEYPAVVVPLYPQHYLMLRRQVLYTAVTRARKRLVLLGSRRAFAMAVRNDRMTLRFGNLRAWLRGERPVRWPREVDAIRANSAE